MIGKKIDKSKKPSFNNLQIDNREKTRYGKIESS